MSDNQHFGTLLTQIRTNPAHSSHTVITWTHIATYYIWTGFSSLPFLPLAWRRYIQSNLPFFMVATRNLWSVAANSMLWKTLQFWTGLQRPPTGTWSIALIAPRLLKYFISLSKINRWLESSTLFEFPSETCNVNLFPMLNLYFIIGSFPILSTVIDIWKFWKPYWKVTW